jgi:hypothetical protein
MKNTTILFFVFISSLLLPLKAVCQNPKTQTQLSMDSILITNSHFSCISQTPRTPQQSATPEVIIMNVDSNDIINSNFSCWGRDICLSVHPVTDKVNCTPGFTSLTTYYDMWGWHYVGGDIPNMADWRQLLNPKL